MIEIIAGHDYTLPQIKLMQGFLNDPDNLYSNLTKYKIPFTGHLIIQDAEKISCCIPSFVSKMIHFKNNLDDIFIFDETPNASSFEILTEAVSLGKRKRSMTKTVSKKSKFV